MVCATSCYQVTFSVYDPLTVITDAEPNWEPYLAESVTPNADNTVWTIKVRPDVTFHDGTPLDGAAVVDNLTRAKNGFLTGHRAGRRHQHRRQPDRPAGRRRHRRVGRGRRSRSSWPARSA